MLSFLYTLLALPLLILFLFMKYKTNIKNSSTTLPKGPKGLPIIGNLHQLDSSNLHFQLLNFSKIYGPLFSLKIGFKQAVVVTTPKLAKQFFKDHDHDVSSKPLSYSTNILSYNGLDLIFSPYNDYWREIRKICVMTLFSSKKISSFSHVREFEVKKMIKKIYKNFYDSNVSNLSEIIMSTSCSILCTVAFGKSYEHEGFGKSRFHGLLNEAQAILVSFFISDYLPFLGWIDKLRGLVARVDNNFKGLNEFLEEVVKEHLDSNRIKEEDEKDIVDVLLDLKKQGHPSIAQTNEHIKAVLVDLLIAGTDSSAATIVWVMTALMKNPRAMKKTQKEIRSLYSKKDYIGEDDIRKLVYLKAVIKETLRFYAPAPLIPRATSKSFILDGYKIEPKTLVYLNIWAIHRDPDTWKDPEEFYPERFLNSNIDFKGQNFEFIPFGVGRRICPGLPLGIVTVEVVVANLINSFDWEMPEGMKKEDIDTEGLPGLTRHKKNHLCLVAKNHK